jgi:hypothetical protein
VRLSIPVAPAAVHADRSAVRQVRRGAGDGEPAGIDRGPGSAPGSSPAWVVVADPASQPRYRGQRPVAARTRAPLAGIEVYEWIALRRVSNGGVAKAGHRWLESDHRVPGYVAGALARLLASGLATLVDPDPDPSVGAVARVALTSTGFARYERLCQQALRLPAAQLIGLCRRFVDGDPDPVRGTPLPD